MLFCLKLGIPIDWKLVMRRIVAALWLLTALAVLSACGRLDWNNPYSAKDAGGNILYSVFTERPKHLDPVQSYSSNEIQFTAQIYQPPLQYHYLKHLLQKKTAVK